MSTYAYIRVSTAMQSYDSQEYEIRKYCKNRNIAIDRWVTESVSGTAAVEKRTLGRLIRRMRKGDTLICTELSRLGRNMLMVMSVLNQCSSKGICIYTIKDSFELCDSINSKIIAFAFALAAEIERNLISQRTKEALAQKKLAGVKLGRPTGSSRKKANVECMREKIRSLIDEGVPMYVIARHCGIHRNTLRKYLIELKLR